LTAPLLRGPRLPVANSTAKVISHRVSTSHNSRDCGFLGSYSPHLAPVKIHFRVPRDDFLPRFLPVNLSTTLHSSNSSHSLLPLCRICHLQDSITVASIVIVTSLPPLHSGGPKTPVCRLLLTLARCRVLLPLHLTSSPRHTPSDAVLLLRRVRRKASV
jgi:hypothetical protein